MSLAENVKTKRKQPKMTQKQKEKGCQKELTAKKLRLM